MKFNDPTGHENEQGDGGGAILTALFQLQGCGGSAMCEQTNVGQWLLDHPTYDPLKDPHFGEHQGYTNILRMLTEIHRENGNQELADQYFFMLNGGIIQQAPLDTGMSLLEGMAVGGAAIAVSGQGGGRGKNNLQPDLDATGPHTTFKRNPDTGEITNYETWGQTDPRNPNPWESQLRVDLEGDPHYSKQLGMDVETPHYHAPGIDVRPARPDQFPGSSATAR